MGTAAASKGLIAPHPGAPAGPAGAESLQGTADERIRALRDTVHAAASQLLSGEPVLLRELHDRLHAACAAVGRDDLGQDAVTIGQQFEAFLERVRGLAEAIPGPATIAAEGLDADARFLRDMAEFLTRRYGVEEVA